METKKPFVYDVSNPCKDRDLTRIFDEEKQNMGLENLDIQLLLPENGNYDSPSLTGITLGRKENGYSITLFPKTIERFQSNSRSIIRHELAHIKHGDLDRDLPRIIRLLYNLFIAEPRARSYE